MRNFSIRFFSFSLLVIHLFYIVAPISSYNLNIFPNFNVQAEILSGSILSTEGKTDQLMGSYSVSDTGEFLYTVNFPSLPAIGPSPNISIDYSSNSGSGNVANGWNVNAGDNSIQICSDSVLIEGKKSAINFDPEIPVFDKPLCLGNKRLVKSPESENFYGEGALENIIAEFRPVLEDGSRILYRENDGIRYFEVWDNGTVYTYGDSQNSQVKHQIVRTDPYTGATIDQYEDESNFKWMLSKVTDSNENFMEYSYINFSDSSVTSDYHEIYLDRITYSNGERYIEFVNDIIESNYTSTYNINGFLSKRQKAVSRIESWAPNNDGTLEKQFTMIFDVDQNNQLNQIDLEDKTGVRMEPLRFNYQTNSIPNYTLSATDIPEFVYYITENDDGSDYSYFNFATDADNNGVTDVFIGGNGIYQPFYGESNSVTTGGGSSSIVDNFSNWRPSQPIKPTVEVLNSSDDGSITIEINGKIEHDTLHPTDIDHDGELEYSLITYKHRDNTTYKINLSLIDHCPGSTTGVCELPSHGYRFEFIEKSFTELNCESPESASSYFGTFDNYGNGGDDYVVGCFSAGSLRSDDYMIMSASFMEMLSDWDTYSENLSDSFSSLRFFAETPSIPDLRAIDLDGDGKHGVIINSTERTSLTEALEPLPDGVYSIETNRYLNEFGKNIIDIEKKYILPPTSGKYVYTDINNDNLPDAIEYSELGIFARINSGNGFLSRYEITPSFSPIGFIDSLIITDLNADNLQDLFVIFRNPESPSENQITIMINNGSGTSFNSRRMIIPHIQEAIIFDIDNDLTPEALIRTGTNEQLRDGDSCPPDIGCIYRAWYNNFSILETEPNKEVPGLLSTVELDGYTQVEVTYDVKDFKASTEAKSDGLCNFPFSCSYPNKLVVDQLEGITGIVEKYEYFDPVFYEVTGAFQGFRKVKITNLESDAVTIRKYDRLSEEFSPEILDEHREPTGKFANFGAPFTNPTEQISYIPVQKGENIYRVSWNIFENVAEFADTSNRFRIYLEDNFSKIYEVNKDDIADFDNIDFSSLSLPIYSGRDSIELDELGRPHIITSRVHDTDTWQTIKTIEYDESSHRLQSWITVPETETTETMAPEGTSITIKTTTIEYDFDGAGNLIEIVREPGNPDFEKTSNFTHYPNGNLRTSSVTAKYNDSDYSTKEITYEYNDPENLYLTNTSYSDTFGTFTSRIDYDQALGVVLSTTDNLGITSHSDYDSFGRIRASRAPQSPEVTFEYNSSPVAGEMEMHTMIHYPHEVVDNYTKTNLLGHLVLNRQETPEGWTVSYNEYDARGRVIRQYLPRFESDSGDFVKTHFQYDNLNRITRSFNPLTPDESSEIIYEKNVIEQTDAMKKRLTRSYFNMFGDVAKTEVYDLTTEEHEPVLTSWKELSYTHNHLLDSSRDMEGNTWEYSYDLYGRLIYSDDPDSGINEFEYNSSDNQMRKYGQTDPTSGMNLIESTTYDPDGYIIETWAHNTGTSIYDYNENGYLRSTTNDDVIETYDYDAFGRQDNITREIVGGPTLSVGYNYNTLGQLERMDYPARLQVEYVYDNFGRNTEVRNLNNRSEVFWRLNSQDALGRVTQSTLGDNISYETNYDAATGKMDSITSTNIASGDILLNNLYKYDLNNNFEEIISKKEEINSVGYKYDYRDRVIEQLPNGSSHFDHEAYEYDNLSNLIKKDNLTENKFRRYSYESDALLVSGPHQLESFQVFEGDPEEGGTLIENEVVNYFNGNMSSINGRDVQYNEFNLPKVIDGSAEFTYTSNGDRASKYNLIDGNTLYYSPGSLSIYSGDDNVYINSIFSPIGVIAQYTEFAVGSTIEYISKDHQGSPAIVTDMDGNIIRESVFNIHGEENRVIDASTTSELYGFTGQESDSDAGVDVQNYNGRIFLKDLGLFASVDPYMSHTDTMGSNSYLYVLGRGNMFTDPTGFQVAPLPDRMDGGNGNAGNIPDGDRGLCGGQPACGRDGGYNSRDGAGSHSMNAGRQPISAQRYYARQRRIVNAARNQTVTIVTQQSETDDDIRRRQEARERAESETAFAIGITAAASLAHAAVELTGAAPLTAIAGAVGGLTDVILGTGGSGRFGQRALPAFPGVRQGMRPPLNPLTARPGTVRPLELSEPVLSVGRGRGGRARIRSDYLGTNHPLEIPTTGYPIHTSIGRAPAEIVAEMIDAIQSFPAGNGAYQSLANTPRVPGQYAFRSESVRLSILTDAMNSIRTGGTFGRSHDSMYRITGLFPGELQFINARGRVVNARSFDVRVFYRAGYDSNHNFRAYHAFIVEISNLQE